MVRLRLGQRDRERKRRKKEQQKRDKEDKQKKEDSAQKDYYPLSPIYDPSYKEDTLSLFESQKLIPGAEKRKETGRRE